MACLGLETQGTLAPAAAAETSDFVSFMGCSALPCGVGAPVLSPRATGTAALNLSPCGPSGSLFSGLRITHTLASVLQLLRPGLSVSSPVFHFPAVTVAAAAAGTFPSVCSNICISLYWLLSFNSTFLTYSTAASKRFPSFPTPGAVFVLHSWEPFAHPFGNISPLSFT